MQQQYGAEEDRIIHWLFSAYVGTSELHEVRSANPTSGSGAIFVAVNDRVESTRLSQVGILRMLFVSPDVWAHAQSDQRRLPDEFRGPPMRSWSRTEKHDDATTYIERVVLENFRCFEHAEIPFRPGMNVLIGQNGTGKTTVLDAIARELVSIPLVLENEAGKIYFADISSKRDVRMARVDKGDTTTFEPQYPTGVRLETRIQGNPIACSSFVRDERGKKTRSGTGVGVPSFDIRDIVRWAIQDGFDSLLPLIAYYGTGRIWRAPKDDNGKNLADLSRWSGYRDCLDPSTNLTKMRAWFRRMELLALQDNHTPAVLEASKRVMLECLEGFDLVRYDARLDDLAARNAKTGLFLSFDQLSDGQRNLLGMVADMAYRAATLNPHLGVDAAKQTPGIVLVDEIDLHLHPAWQRRIIGDLQRAFPRIQFIATTHSPQVLSAVSDDSIIILEDNQFYRSPAPTQGRDTNSILAEVLGTSVRPAETIRQIAAVTQLLDDRRYEEARAGLNELAAHLTERDPDMIRLRNLLDIVEGIDEADSKGD